MARKTSKARQRTLRYEALESRRLLAAGIVIENPNIKGDSSDKFGENQVDDLIETNGFSWGISRISPTTVPFVRDFRFEKQLDIATPDLTADAARGPNHDQIEFRVRGATENTDDVLIKLTNARLTSFDTQDTPAPGRSGTFEEVLTSFTGIRFEYTDLSANQKSSSEFNLLTNKSMNSILDSKALSAKVDGPFFKIEGDDSIFPVLGYNWSAALPLNFVGGSAFPGDPQGGELLLTRPLDIGTARLMSIATQNSFQTSPTSKGFFADSLTLNDQISVKDTSSSDPSATKSVTNATWKFYEPFITSLDIAGGDDLAAAASQVSISYSKVEVEYTPFEFNGKSGTPTNVTWDLGTDPDTVSGTSGFGNTNLDDEVLNQLVFPDGSELEFDAIQWSLGNSFDPVTKQTSGFQLGDVIFFATVDTATPGMIAALAGGQSGKYVVKRQQTSGKTAQLIDEWTLTDGFLTSYAVNGSEQQQDAIQFGISFSKATLKQENFDEVTSTGKFESTLDAQTNNATLAGFGGQNFDNNEPELELTFIEGGQHSDVAISSLQWSAAKSGSEPTVDPFSIEAPRGDHTLGVISSVAGRLDTSNLIDQVVIKRHATIADDRRELYRWELDGVSVSDFSAFRPEDSSSAFDFFNLVPQKIKFSTFDYDNVGKLVDTQSVLWDQVVNKVTGTNVGELGPLPSTDILPMNLEFSDGSKLSLDSFNWGSSLEIAAPAKSGARFVGAATSRDAEFQSFGAIPSVAQLNAFATGKSISAPLTYETSVFDFKSQLVPYATWEFGGLAPIKGFSFFDAQGGNSGSSIAVGFQTLDQEFRQVELNGGFGPTTGVDWDIPSNLSKNQNGFGTLKYFTDAKSAPPQSSNMPKNVLTFTSESNQPQVAVQSYVWGTRNPIDQLVGTGKAAPRSTANRDQFFIQLEYSETSSGLIHSLAAGRLLDELTLTSFESFDDNGSAASRPFREWKLEDVFVTSYDVGVFDGAQPGSAFLTLDIGRITDTITRYTPGASSSASSAGDDVGQAAAAAADIAETFTNFVDYITPPQSVGVPDVQTFDLSTRAIPLPSFFTDEQESSATLSYSFNIDSGSSLFSSVNIGPGNDLELDMATGQVGTATITVNATDSFGLVGSDTFDVVIGLAPDFGDAPSPFPTTLAENGASHAAIGPRLGLDRDREPDGLPSAAADADGSDDGVMFGAIQVGAAMAGINIDLQNAANAKVDAWVDFNANGIWEPGEKILSGETVIAGVQTKNFNIPGTSVPGLTYARVRVSSTGVADPTGTAVDGEVEDYQVNILPVAPQVEDVIINGGAANRSKVTTLQVRFDTEVDHTSLSSAFTVTNITTNTPVGTVNVAASDVGGKTTAVLAFAGASTLAPQLGTLATSLLDGNYRLDIAAAQVKLVAGNLANMPANDVFGGQSAGAPNNDEFYRLYGDDNGDGFTDFNDFANSFLPAFGSEVGGVGMNYHEGMDANGDGFVDFNDFANDFLPRFGTQRP